MEYFDFGVNLSFLLIIISTLTCVVYGIVPKTTLKNILEKRAKQIAAKRMSHASYSMGLEAQSVDKEKNQEQFDELVQELLSGSAKKLWDDK